MTGHEREWHRREPDTEPVPPDQHFSGAQVAEILETIASAVVIIAADTGRFIYANRHAHELYGTNYLGVELNDHARQVKALRPIGKPYAVEELPASRSIRNGEVVRNDEIIFQRSSGEQLTVLVSSSPLYDRDGRIVAAVADFRDISDLKNTVAELTAALDTARERTRELDAVIENVPDGLAVFGRDQQLIYINRKGHELTSLFMTTDPASGRVMLHAYDEAGQPVRQEDEFVSQLFSRGETIHNQVFSTAPDREPVTWINMSGAPIRDESGALIGAIILSRDITERRNSERKIAFQSHILECVQDAILATDEHFRLTYWNKPAEALFGWTSEEVLGCRTFEFLKPILPEQTVDKGISQLMKNGTYAGEVVYHHKDGTAIDVENRSHLIRDPDGRGRETVTTVRDIRGRKQAELALRESEQKYRELVQHAPTGIFEFDIVNHRFLDVNDCMLEMSGYSRDELMTKDPFDLLDPATRGRSMERLRKWANREPLESKIDHTWITKDGRPIHVDLITSFSHYVDGRPTVMTGIAHDITQRKELEMALQRQAEELKAADRNKNQFLNVLSHELRNPLAVITASADILAHFEVNEEKSRRTIHALQRQSTHLTRLVDDLLDVTRITTGKIRLKQEPVNLISLVGRAVSDAQPQYAAKGVVLSALLPEEPIILNADSDRLTQAIGNLLDNALKFTPADGYVHVAVSLEAPTGATTRTGAVGAPIVRIAVTDNGAGISPDILPHLFEPFSQAEQTLARTQGGLGLGLSIAKGMVELHGGSVKAESEGVDKGATFTIELPLPSRGDS